MDITKLHAEITRSREKILKEQARLRRLERTKTEMENAAIIAEVRSEPFSMEEFQAFMVQKRQGMKREGSHEN